MNEACPLRVNIGPRAENVLLNGVPGTGMNDPLRRAYYDQDQDAVSLWKKHKPELAALSAVLIDRIYARVEDERRGNLPYGILQPVTGNPSIFESVESFDVADPYKLLGCALKTTLTNGLKREFSYLDTSEDEEIQTARSVYNRYQDILLFRKKSIYPHNVDSYTHMQSGIENVAEVYSSFVRLVPILTERKFPDRETSAVEMSLILGRSFSQVAEFAMMHFYQFVSIFQSIRQYPGLNPDFFEIKGNVGKERIVLKDEGRKYTKELIEKVRLLRPHGEEITGCPAMVSFFGADSVARKLHAWVVDLSKEVYGVELQKRDQVTPGNSQEPEFLAA